MNEPADPPNWPDDADGDVLRRIASRGFDFATPHVIDFDVDFDDWPPPAAALRWLRRTFGEARLVEPSGYEGYVNIQVTERLSYGFVVATQKRISEAMAAHGGVCECWGVLQEPKH